MKTILVANRGEIACRLLRTVHDLGYRSVAVFSDADADAPHVDLADQAVWIGPSAAAQSYLSAEAVLDAARRTGADALHPGYGFLSENADFARACRNAGITFIGPSPESIAIMGDKRMAKETMIAAGVPCIPGYQGEDQSPATLAREARRIGFPLMVKASAGGGGRGIRLVRRSDEIEKAIRSAASEAQSSFGDGTLYLEKTLSDARHIEVQIVADMHGRVLHLGERDCSAQRRNQKVIEEAPAASLSPSLRAEICASAVAAAKAIDYVGAGTVEFLLDGDGRFHFLEMNTRLQVEHPVTEMITGLDLVALQLQAASGLPLSLAQEDIRFRGHAMEARLYTEDPAESFLPQSGTAHVWEPASGRHVRIDAGIRRGRQISPHYDSMVAKLVAWGETRAEANRRLSRAIRETVLLGIRHNGEYLNAILNSEAFAAATLTTGHLADNEELCRREPPDPLAVVLAALLYGWDDGQTAGRWRQNGRAHWQVGLDDPDVRVTLERTLSGELVGCWGSHRLVLTPLDIGDGRLVFICEGIREQAVFSRQGARLDMHFRGRHLHFVAADRSAGDRAAQSSGDLVAPMSAAVVDVSVNSGDTVDRGQTLFVLEAMKMEIEVKAEIGGPVAGIAVAVGDQVSKGQLLATIGEPEET